jgi:hypothetical protein
MGLPHLAITEDCTTFPTFDDPVKHTNGILGSLETQLPIVGPSPQHVVKTDGGTLHFLNTSMTMLVKAMDVKLQDGDGFQTTQFPHTRPILRY